MAETKQSELMLIYLRRNFNNENISELEEVERELEKEVLHNHGRAHFYKHKSKVAFVCMQQRYAESSLDLYCMKARIAEVKRYEGYAKDLGIAFYFMEHFNGLANVLRREYCELLQNLGHGGVVEEIRKIRVKRGRKKKK